MTRARPAPISTGWSGCGPDSFIRPAGAVAGPSPVSRGGPAWRAGPLFDGLRRLGRVHGPSAFGGPGDVMSGSRRAALRAARGATGVGRCSGASEGGEVAAVATAWATRRSPGRRREGWQRSGHRRRQGHSRVVEADASADVAPRRPSQASGRHSACPIRPAATAPRRATSRARRADGRRTGCRRHRAAVPGRSVRMSISAKRRSKSASSASRLCAPMKIAPSSWLYSS